MGEWRVSADGGEAKRKRIVAFVEGYLEEKGIAPSLREICAGAEISSTSVVSYHLTILERRGVVTRQAGIPRSLRLVGPVSVAELWDRS